MGREQQQEAEEAAERTGEESMGWEEAVELERERDPAASTDINFFFISVCPVIIAHGKNAESRRRLAGGGRS